MNRVIGRNNFNKKRHIGRRKKSKFNPSTIEIDIAVKQYLNNGGIIHQIELDDSYLEQVGFSFLHIGNDADIFLQYGYNYN